MVNMKEIFADRRINGRPMERVPMSDAEKASSLLREGDLLFARQSLVLSGAGKCVLFIDDQEDVTFESHIIRCRLNRRIAEPAYYFYLFESKIGRDLIESIVEQVSAAGIRGTDLGRLCVPCPPLLEQKRIASILGALDDKIELNRKMNETLEQMARALFKSWFIDFDPVHAMSSGHQLAGVDKETAKLFPDSFIESDLGKIPQGWKVGSVYEISELKYGAPFASGLFNSTRTGKPLVRIRDLADESPGVFTTEVHPKGYLLQPGDIAVGMDGEFRAYLWAGVESWLNQRICVFVPKDGFSAAFVRNSIMAPLSEVESTGVADVVCYTGNTST